MVRLFEMVSVGKAMKPAHFHAWAAAVPLRGEHPHFSRIPEIDHGVEEEARRRQNDREVAEEEAHWSLLGLPSLGLRSHRVHRLRREAHVRY